MATRELRCGRGRQTHFLVKPDAAGVDAIAPPLLLLLNVACELGLNGVKVCHEPFQRRGHTVLY